MKPLTNKEAREFLYKAGWQRHSFSSCRIAFLDKQGREHNIILDEKRPWVVIYHSLSVKETSLVYLVSGKAMYDEGGRSKSFAWYLKPENMESIIYNGRYKKQSIIS